MTESGSYGTESREFESLERAEKKPPNGGFFTLSIAGDVWNILPRFFSRRGHPPSSRRRRNAIATTRIAIAAAS
jgi:hypothetical protein